MLGGALCMSGAGEMAKWVMEVVEQAGKRGTLAGSMKLGQEAGLLAKAGRYAEAAERFNQAAAAERAAGTGEAQKAAALELDRGASILRAQQVASLLDRPLVARTFREALDEFPPGKRKLIQLIEEVSTGVLPINIVSPRVKVFISSFARGATSTEAHETDRFFRMLWDAAPLDLRVFIIGAGADEPLIQEIKAKLEANGYTVFFYKSCSPLAEELCSSATVGSYFGTAGHAIVVQTDASARSLYIPYEIAAAQTLQKGQALFLMVTPTEILEGARRGVETATVLAFREEVHQRTNQH